MDKRKVIILGSAHENTIGMVQSLGRQGVYVIGVLLHGGGIVKKCIYINEIFPVDDYQQGIDFIAKNLVFPTPTVIIPCGDEAALLLEKNKELLKDNFLFQHTKGEIALADAMNKYVQTNVASSCGFDVPVSLTIEKGKHYDKQKVVYPCIIKPLASFEGDKKDIQVVKSLEDFETSLSKVFKHSNRAIVQQFIAYKDYELNILGCGLSNGEAIIPCSIRKLRIHPKERGSVSVGLVEPFIESQEKLIDSIKKMVKEFRYVGLFSVELMCVEATNKSYFIEMNLRNDALNPFVVKAGVNLPYLHYLDLIGEEFPPVKTVAESKKIILEPIHFTSLYRRSVSVWEWVKDIVTADAFSLYYKEDKKLFWSQFTERIKGRLRRTL